MLKVWISSVKNDYPGITGDHEFESLEKAIDFARYGAKGLEPEQGDKLIINFDPMKMPGYHEDCDVEIIIYDWYIE